MINDYKYRYTSHDFDGHKRHRRLGLLALISLALMATAVYASMQMLQTDEQAGEKPQTTPHITESQATADSSRHIELKLPGTIASDGQTRQETGEGLISTLTITAQEKPRLQVPTPPTEDPAEGPDETALPTQHEPVAVEDPSAAEPDITALPEEPTDTQPLQWLEEKVRSGDSLARIFSRLKLSPSVLHAIVNSSEEAGELANIRPGQTLKIRLDYDGTLKELIHQRSRINSLQITADGDSYRAEIINRAVDTRVAELSGTITNSLYLSAQEAGLSDALIMELANIFGWDIDFALEIRAGDRFSVIYEEQYLDGEKIRNGAILAAEFVNQGKTHRAIRYEDSEGYASYFSPDGKSMRKAFLRAPVDFRRISSRFTRERWHPVLGKKRPHRGVDYAAAIGTPIKSAGDGKVIFVGHKGGYGKTVIIQHANRYTTLYAHMNGYKKGIKSGARVKQGQTIGYVGKTGLATGPHLHYEFRVDGAHRNPLTVKLPAALPIEKKYLNDFLQKSEPLLAKLDSLTGTMLAEASSDN